MGNKKHDRDLWFKFLTAATVFRVVTPCSSETAICFGGTYRLQLQGRRVTQETNHQKQEAGWDADTITAFSSRDWQTTRNLSPVKIRIENLSNAGLVRYR
jgi:hypothetical protein